MNDTAVETVRHFVAHAVGMPVDQVHLEASLLHDLGVDGDDAVELLNAFAARFGVNMDGFDLAAFFGPERPLCVLTFLVNRVRRKVFPRLEVRHLAKALERISLGFLEAR